MTSKEPPSAGEQALTTADTRLRLDLLADLGYGFLESGQTGGWTIRTLTSCGKALGLTGLSITSFGRLLMLDAARADGATVSLSGAARALDTIDCNRSRALTRVADDLSVPYPDESPASKRERLLAAQATVQRLRETSSPWWVVTLGMTMLAFFISMQVGITWQAWVTAALLQVIASATGLAIGRISMPKVFLVAIQSGVTGAVATLLVQLGFVDPVGAAAAIAVNWLLLLPLPQIIGAVTDAIEADHLSALTRVASVAVAGLGIVIGGAFTFGLGEMLGMAHPRLDELPSLPWYLVLVFSALGAIGNAFANGGRLPLVLPAAALGLATAATNQVLLHGVGLPTLWANSLSAVVLGLLTVVFASRTGDPQPVLGLVGITGALLPGIPVFFGILQEMGDGSGAEHFGTAIAICLGIGTGLAFGAYLASLRRAR